MIFLEVGCTDAVEEFEGVGLRTTLVKLVAFVFTVNSWLELAVLLSPGDIDVGFKDVDRSVSALKVACVESRTDRVVAELFLPDVKVDIGLDIVVVDDETRKLVASVAFNALKEVLAATVGVLLGRLLLSSLLVTLELGAETATNSDTLEEPVDKAVLLGRGVGVGVGDKVLQDWMGAGRQRAGVISISLEMRGRNPETHANLQSFLRINAGALTIHDCVIKICIENG